MDSDNLEIYFSSYLEQEHQIQNGKCARFNTFELRILPPTGQE